MHLLRTSVVVAVAGACCGSVLAQSASRGPWYVAPSISLFKPDKQWSPNKSDVGFGLKLGRTLTPNWDLRLGVETARSKDQGASYRQILIGLDAVYLFRDPGRRIRPLITVGVGSSRDRISKGGVTDVTPYFSAGLGLRYQLNTKLDLQLEWKTVRNISQRTKRDFIPRNSDNNYLGLSLNYAFGEPAAAAHTAPTPPPAVEPPPLPPPIVKAPPPPEDFIESPVEEAQELPPVPRSYTETFALEATELFEFDKAVLRGAQPELDALADKLKQDRSITRVVVFGHTDRLGSNAYNYALSKRRADAMKRYLVKKGVRSSRIHTVPMGETQPVKECQDQKRSLLIACLAPNRRAVIEPITITIERQEQ